MLGAEFLTEQGEARPAAYLVIDSRNGRTVGRYSDRRRARARADKLDLDYGAIRYRVRTLWEAMQ
jgi:hypothetical protein